METVNYNKEHVLNAELKKIESLTERVKSASKILSDEVEFFKVCSAEVDSAANLIVPSMKHYLKLIMEVRMAFAREVQEILRSSREITEIVKMAPRIDEAVESIINLGKALDNPSLINNIKNTFNVKEENK